MLRISSARFGLGIFAGVLALGAALLISPGSKIENWKLKISEPALAGTTTSAKLAIVNATPQVSALTLNNASSIILTTNTTTQVTVSFTVTDDNGCSGVFVSGSVTTTLYREGVSTTCATAYPAESNRNYLNCYVNATTTYNCVSTSTSAQATTTFNVWYFAEATDASSSYSGEAWSAFVQAQDASSAQNSTTTATNQELLSLLGMNVETSSISYGTVNPGSDTTSTNQVATVKNAGNSSTTLRLNGIAMCSGGTCIATSSQHYSTSTFTYGTSDNPLQGSATDVGGFSVPRPPLGIWQETAKLPAANGQHSAVVNNGYLYVTGGFNGGTIYTSTVRYTTIGPTGTLGAWATTTNLPTATALHSAVVNNGFIYAIGGYDGSVRTSTVLYATIGSTGTLGAWATTTALPTGTSLHSAAVNNSYLYVVGGFSNLYTSTVLYAPIGSTGTIGTWVETTKLPTGTGYHSAVVNNGYLYVTGGYNGTYTSTVLYAPIGSTGTIGTWAETTKLSTGIRQHSAVVNNGYLYVTGGITGGPYTSTVLYAPIGSTGTIGIWAETTKLPAATAQHSAVVNNGYLYVTGGDIAGSFTSTVLMASLATRNTYWGAALAAGTAAGNYTGQNTFTAVFQP